ncbi:MAG: CotH kinase family protein, partial [Sedimentisphaerales bacterium]|nr:CotH kinase family protein [Sedimentisphaerales bacterium]
GTPGSVNSVYSDNLAPMIVNLQQEPIIPQSNEDVIVTCRIISVQLPSRVELWWRVDTSEYSDENTYPSFDLDGFQVVTMSNLEGDVYTGVIPAQENLSVIEFFIRAVGTNDEERTYPALCDVDGVQKQAANCLYQVDDAVAASCPWDANGQPVYRVILTGAELGRLTDIGGLIEEGEPTWYLHEAMTRAQMNATFISMDGGGMELRYNTGIRNRGNRSRFDPPMNYRVNFVHDRRWKGVEAVNLNSKYPHSVVVGYAIYRLAGMPAPNSYPIQMRVNGLNPAEVYDDYARTYNSYIAVEAYDSEWTQSHVPDDDQGNVYRGTYTMRLDGTRTEADLAYLGDQADPYRENYFKQTNGSEDDWTDLIQLCRILNDETISDSNFIAEVETVLDLEQWARWMAMDTLFVNWEKGLASGMGDDYAMYRGVIDPRFILLPHDMDTLMGQGDGGYDVVRDIFYMENVPGLTRLVSHPDFVKVYYEQIEDLLKNVFNSEKIDPLLDQLLKDWVPDEVLNGFQGMKQFVIDRAENVYYGETPQIPHGPLTVDGPSVTTENLVDLSGSFNAITTRSVTVDGVSVKEEDWSQREGTWSFSAEGMLNPGMNRITIQAYDEVGGQGQEVERMTFDILYDTGSTNDQAGELTGSSQDTVNVAVLTRHSYRSGIPILVRVELRDNEGQVRRDIWDATAQLSIVDNSGVALSTDQIALYNGLGSSLVAVSGTGDFTLDVSVGQNHASRFIIDWTEEPVTSVAAGLVETDMAWRGVVHVIDDLLIPSGVTLTIEPGTLVLLEGFDSGTNGVDIDVEGLIQSLGTDQMPVTFTAATPARNWGEFHFTNADPSFFGFTNINQAGRSPGIGHSGTGPAFRISGSTVIFEYSNITDNAGKLGHCTSGSDLTFDHCLFARGWMGPEISGTALQFEDSWITDMHANDDADGIYIHSQLTGQSCRMLRSVIANVDDDGIDTLGSEVTVEDCIIRDGKDKAISIYNGLVNILRCLIVDNNRIPEDPTVASIAVKTTEGATATVNIDRSTIVTAKTDGVVDFGIQSHNKYNISAGMILWNITNSIIDATDPIDVQAPYLESDIYVEYSNVFGEDWPGIGNINTDPLFLNPVENNYRLNADSPCIDTGDPSSQDPDGTRVDMGVFPYLAPSAETIIWTPTEGPYRMIEDVIVPSHITLQIEPGTCVFFEPDVRMTVHGTLRAEGTLHDPIWFTRAYGSDETWEGVQINGSENDNIIRHAIMKYGRSNEGMLGVVNSKATIEQVFFDYTDLRRLYLRWSSVVVRECTFTDVFEPGRPPTTDNYSEQINGIGIPTDGYVIIENNVFGRNTGHNDVIDFTSPIRIASNGSILQVLNNVFHGGGDEILDLGGDALIEGNHFAHVHLDEYNGGTGESNVISTGDNLAGQNNAVVALVRNIFHDVDHVINLKHNSSAVMENNTIVGIADDTFDEDQQKWLRFSAVNFLIPDRDPPGLGAWLNGNILWKIPQRIFDHIDEDLHGNPQPNRTILDMHHSLMSRDRADDAVAARPITVSQLGIANLSSDPLFMDGLAGDFHLRPGSPALGSGPWGLDIGAFVPGG